MSLRAIAQFSLRQLEYFVAVAQEGTIKAAAERLETSSAAISLAISQFERTLGAQLFVRQHGKGVALTETGQRILAECRTVLTRAEHIVDLAHDATHSLVGPVRIGCFAPFMPFVAPLILDDVAKRYPEIEFVISTGAPSALRSGLANGTIDIAVLTDRWIDDSLTTQVARIMRPYVALSADHPLAHHNEVALVELADEPLLTFALDTTEQYVDDLLRQAGITPSRRQSLPDIESVRSLVARGLGYSILLLPIPSDVSYEGRSLVRVNISDEVAPSQMVVALAKGVEPVRRVSVIALRLTQWLGIQPEVASAPASRTREEVQL